METSPAPFYRRGHNHKREVVMRESVHLSTAGTGAEYAAPDATVTVKVGGEHTGAQYEIFEIDAPRGPAAPPHRESWSKAFYVLTPSAKFLAISQTARMGAFFAELATADPTDFAALGEISSRHGVTLAQVRS